MTRSVYYYRSIYVDSATNYRYYAADQLPLLNRIIALKDLGFSLDQIGLLLNDHVSLDEMRGMLKLRRAAVEQTVRREQQRLV
ncbi:MAG: MerR family transcriptional regulator [Chloroflexi bacterium AL-W]|nr:MerR family transcriptional regulator [Chloroflexi bacterium AL-N1]NOK67211.1 MerR family transcriptional regulator [Chloroflexi bacterium AL-N10]NOK75295.1 MerR family transcriptional regulator [Chloroflexi bacterium AL-N5]NOK82083.1 MerR family transcriptional regulator [Chloroflexi bacterium AL-W]NOK89928.1 MerR family transcriptional regulator [Chloroflexi bacterium AL-N15]